MSQPHRWILKPAVLEIEGANLLTLRDGKLARLELFRARTEALEATGLSM